MNQPIRRLTQVQTGTADLHVEHVEGSSWNPLWWIFFGRKLIEGMPVSVFVIEHEDGIVLVDAGMSPTVATDEDFWPDPITRGFMRRIFRFHIGDDDALGHQLQLAGYDPATVVKAAITHLHFDHAGGIADIPHAELVVSQEAWEHSQQPHAGREAVLRRHLEVPGAKWKPITFTPLDDETLLPFTRGHDLMGDGSIMLLPTPGHLEGSLSVFVRTNPAVLFVGDLCYREDLMMNQQLPGTGEHDQLLASWAKVHELLERHPGMLIVPTHDRVGVRKLLAHPLARPGEKRAAQIAGVAHAARDRSTVPS